MMMNRDGTRKPCIALMGEFSAGKSTLANLLIGADPLPVQVVATQLPPVCISYGTDPAFTVDADGNETALDVMRLDSSNFNGIAYIQIYLPEDILKKCDLLDMPGISDPNMSPAVWERMIKHADGVLWCSHATQAWRQSEAAVWAEMPVSLYQSSLLLLTRIDKLQTDRDRDRVLTRVRHETSGLFLDILPISLLLATQEQDDYALWATSGAEVFATRLIALLDKLTDEIGASASNECAELRLSGFEPPMNAPAIQPRRAQPRVVPRRVVNTVATAPANNL